MVSFRMDLWQVFISDDMLELMQVFRMFGLFFRTEGRGYTNWFYIPTDNL